LVRLLTSQDGSGLCGRASGPQGLCREAADRGANEGQRGREGADAAKCRTVFISQANVSISDGSAHMDCFRVADNPGAARKLKHYAVPVKKSMTRVRCATDPICRHS